MEGWDFFCPDFGILQVMNVSRDWAFMVRFYQGACLPGAAPGAQAALRWLLMTRREQCTTDHVSLFGSQSTKNVYLCSRGT